jgi:hypothetical protein
MHGGDGTYVFQLRSTSPYVRPDVHARPGYVRSIVTMHVPRSPGYARGTVQLQPTPRPIDRACLFLHLTTHN